MSSFEGDRECPRCEDAAAYLLGALGDDERDYRAHLMACAFCQTEVGELRGVTADVPSIAAPAADQLRERVMAIVRSEAELLNAARAGVDLGAHPRRRWGVRASSLAAAGALAGAAVIAALIVKPSSPAVRMVSARTAFASPKAHAVLREVGDRGELIFAGLPEPPPGEAYEVWVRKAGHALRPTDALFMVNRDGNGSVDVPGSLRGVREILVSAEPVGGSAQLTGAVLIDVSVPL